MDISKACKIFDYWAYSTLTQTEYRILLCILAGSGRRCSAEVSEILQISPQSANKACKALRDRGLVLEAGRVGRAILLEVNMDVENILQRRFSFAWGRSED